VARMRLYGAGQPYRNDLLLSQRAQYFLIQSRLAEADRALRECLTLREKQVPDGWRTFNTKSMLGGALLRQKKYSDAGPLLLAGYEGMKEREATIPVEGKPNLKEALERLVQLCEATDRPDEAAQWKQKLAEFDRAR